MKKTFAYIAFILFITVFFLYVLFPSETVKSYLAFRFSKLAPECRLSIARLRPAIPPGLSAFGVDIKCRQDEAVSSDRILVNPAYKSILKGRPGIDFDAALYGGKVTGTVDFVRTKQHNGLSAALQIKSVDLKPIPIVKTIFRYTVFGLLSGKIEYRGPFNGNGTGAAHLLAKKCGIEFPTPVIGLASLSFDTMQLELKIDKQRLEIEKLVLKGRDLSVSAAGTVVLALNKFADSRISLKGTLRPSAEIMNQVGAFFPKKYIGQGGVPFRVTGTFAALNYSFR